MPSGTTATARTGGVVHPYSTGPLLFLPFDDDLQLAEIYRCVKGRAVFHGHGPAHSPHVTATDQGPRRLKAMVSAGSCTTSRQSVARQDSQEDPRKVVSDGYRAG